MKASYDYFLGVDVSKEKLDVCLLTPQGEPIFYQCPNKVKDIVSCFSSWLKEHDLEKEKVLICWEITGYYSNCLRNACVHKKWNGWMESPAQIKFSQGVTRGKSDKTDALAIALYAKRFQDRCVLVQPVNPVLEQLSELQKERASLLLDRNRYKVQMRDEKGFKNKEYCQQKAQRRNAIVEKMDKALKEIDKQLTELIRKDEAIYHQYKLLLSIDGIGRETALAMLVMTECFSRFKDARKFICYAGCAPFEYRSGTSVRSARKVSKKANKRIKTLLHMASLSVIRMKGEFRQYFERKLAEGKNKMTILNAIRAKLITRAFAVIAQNKKYDKNYAASIG